jgi:hypothetical protein
MVIYWLLDQRKDLPLLGRVLLVVYRLLREATYGGLAMAEG